MKDFSFFLIISAHLHGKVAFNLQFLTEFYGLKSWINTNFSKSPILLLESGLCETP